MYLIDDFKMNKYRITNFSNFSWRKFNYRIHLLHEKVVGKMLFTSSSRIKRSVNNKNEDNSKSVDAILRLKFREDQM